MIIVIINNKKTLEALKIMELSSSISNERSSSANIHLKVFVEAIGDYLRARTENDATVLKKCLKVRRNSKDFLNMI